MNTHLIITIVSVGDVAARSLLSFIQTDTDQWIKTEKMLVFKRTIMVVNKQYSRVAWLP